MGKRRSHLSDSTQSSTSKKSNVSTDSSDTQASGEQRTQKSPSSSSWNPFPLLLMLLLALPFVDRMESLLWGWRTVSVLERVSPQPDIIATPLAMTGGDPYIRALMRTISASEANYANPYTIAYGGRRIKDLSRHPDRCYPIEAGPNVGLCTTAAGRYQFITPTWEWVAQTYHPQQTSWWWLQNYSFEPKYQDQVVHNWLADSAAWNADIPLLLRQQRLDTVFKLLASTWTSLDSGIEENAITPYLYRVYSEALAEELASD